VRMRGVSVSLGDVEGGSMIDEERNFGKFSCAICERPSPGAENALVTKTEGGSRGYPSWEGEGSR
jgi:hypothetical protein